MDVEDCSYCTVFDSRNQTKYICFTRRTGGVFTVCLTDAAAVWSSEFTEETLSQLRQKLALKSTQEYILKFKAACSSGDVSVLVEDSSADLHVGPGPSVALSRMEGSQSTEALRELLFTMADRLTQLGGNSSFSPFKTHQRCPAEFEPRQQQQSAASSTTIKRRLQGASLINPGTKKKVQATGVAFDDAEED